MGTRHITLVKQDKNIVVAQYGQWDGYYEGAGLDIANQIKSFDMDVFREKISKCTFIGKAKLDQLYITDKKPFFIRDTGSEVLSLIYNSKDEVIELWSDEEFTKDGLFCEYGYMIDLDSNKLIVFEGFYKKPLSKDEIFYSDGYSRNGYYPIREVKRFTLDKMDDAIVFLSGKKN